MKCNRILKNNKNVFLIAIISGVGSGEPDRLYAINNPFVIYSTFDKP